MTMQLKKDSHKTWNNSIFTVEAIIDETLWDKQLIIDFQKTLNKISDEICKNSDLIKTNKIYSVSVLFSGDKKIIKAYDHFNKV